MKGIGEAIIVVWNMEGMKKGILLEGCSVLEEIYVFDVYVYPYKSLLL